MSKSDTMTTREIALEIQRQVAFMRDAPIHPAHKNIYRLRADLVVGHAQVLINRADTRGQNARKKKMSPNWPDRYGDADTYGNEFYPDDNTDDDNTEDDD